jgi:hypothetical protein
MEEMFVSLEAVNAFEQWMRELPEAIHTDPKLFANRLLELAEEHEVENLDEIVYLLRKYWSQLEEYIPASDRYTVESCFEF